MTVFNITTMTSIKMDFSNAITTKNFIGIDPNVYLINWQATKLSKSTIILSPNTSTTFQGIASHNQIINIIIFNANEQFILTCSGHVYNKISNEDEFTITHVLNGTTGVVCSLSPSECVTMYP